MTISTPTLPTDPTATSATNSADAGLLALFGTANAPAGQTLADGGSADAPGFADLLSDTEAPAPAPAEATTNEQAAAFAAALLWTPAPQLAETTPDAGLTCANGEPTAAEVTTGTSAPEQTGFAAAPAGSREACAPDKLASPEAIAAMPDTAGQNPANKTVVKPATPPAAAPVAVEVSAPATTAALETTEAVAPAAGIAAENEPEVPTDVPAATGLELVDRRPMLRASGPVEKIAAPTGRSLKGFEPRQSVEAKTFLSVTQQAGRGAAGIVGTSVAKPEPTMPSAPVIQPPVAEKSAALPVLAIPASSQGPATQVTLPEFNTTVTSDPAVQARDAVAAVMQVVNAQEAPASGAARVVNLDFNFGADRLAVRVEQLHDGTVQAHFRTDSHEVRAALAHEWQQAAAAPENILRLAEPFYHTSARGDQSANFGTNADGSASQQGQARAQQQAAAGFTGRPSRAASRPLSVTTTTPEAPRVRSSSSARHLQAVA